MQVKMLKCINVLPLFVYTKLVVGGCVGCPVKFGICLGLQVQKVHLHPPSFLRHVPHTKMKRYGTVLPWWMKVNADECLWSRCLDVFNLVEEAERGWGGAGVNSGIVLAAGGSGCVPCCTSSPPPAVSRSFVRSFIVAVSRQGWDYDVSRPFREWPQWTGFQNSRATGTSAFITAFQSWNSSIRMLFGFSPTHFPYVSVKNNVFHANLPIHGLVLTMAILFSDDYKTFPSGLSVRRQSCHHGFQYFWPVAYVQVRNFFLVDIID